MKGKFQGFLEHTAKKQKKNRKYERKIMIWYYQSRNFSIHQCPFDLTVGPVLTSVTDIKLFFFLNAIFSHDLSNCPFLPLDNTGHFWLSRL